MITSEAVRYQTFHLIAVLLAQRQVIQAKDIPSY